MNTTNDDEPLSPAGRLFVQPATHQIINCALGLEQPLGFEAAKHVVSDSLMVHHPRFSSILVTDTKGHEYWQKTDIDLDLHVILIPDQIGEHEHNSDETAINEYLANLAVSSPLSFDKPLWEIHLIPAHKCVVLRIHHALGDGISLMSLMLTLARRLDDPCCTPTIEPLGSTRRKQRVSNLEVVVKVVKMIVFSLIYVFEFIMRGLWMKDGKTVVRGGEGVEMWPRKVVTARFTLEDMKTVKNAVTDATINDVLFGIISLGLSKYLGNRSPDSLQEGLQITGVAMVNLRPSPGLQVTYLEI